LFSDNFEDGNTAGWTLRSGAWSVTTAAGSKALTQSATGTAVATAGSSAWTATDVRVTATNVSTTGKASAVLVLARVRDASNYYALALRDANKVELRRVVAGTSTVLASAPLQAATGKAFALRLVVKGGTLTGYVDGVKLVTASDTTFAAGTAGVVSENAVARFDDVAVLTA
jgi:pectate lyase